MNALRETYLTDDIGPLPFCPGCGHERLVKALDQALFKLQPDPKKVVIVTDIGCIGLADRHFVTHAFHGLHGRSITYACGLKLARPELTVIVLTGFDRDLSERIADAIRQPGFAMLDVWDMCTAYYLPRNQLRKKDLTGIMEQLGLKAGVLVDRPRPEYVERYREVYATEQQAPRQRPRITAKYANAVGAQTGIVIAGSAGQKIRSAAGLFAQAGMFAGLSATQKDDYPITVMTGHSVTEIILSPERIDYTAIDSPDYFVVVSQDGLNKSRGRIEKLAGSATLYAEESLDLPPTEAKVVQLPFIATAKQVNRLSIGVVALSAMLRDNGLFPLKALGESISTLQKQALADVNMQAVEAGATMMSVSMNQ
jgi:Pyruvate/2-oxoacid:ferredoxin oxidoreductase gamma subunit